MNYSEGRTGRVIIARFEDGEDFISGMKKLVQKAKLTSGLIFFLGALRSGEIVVGPVRDAIPPEPGWESLEGVWEVVGIGTLFEADGEPSLHMHGAHGKGTQSLTGCLRNIAGVFLIVEVIILEIIDTDARRVYDPLSRLFLLHPSPEKRTIKP